MNMVLNFLLQFLFSINNILAKYKQYTQQHSRSIHLLNEPCSTKQISAPNAKLDQKNFKISKFIRGKSSETEQTSKMPNTHYSILLFILIQT